MNNRMRLVALFAIYASLSSPALAYLDPATGSIAVQALIGLIATWMMYTRMFAAKLRNFFGRLSGKGGEASKPE